MAHHRIWLFRPAKQQEAAFARAYSADGPWAALFGRASGFVGTQLLRPAHPGGWWLTIDSWTDEGAFDRFQAEMGDAYRALDRELEGVAGEERFVGAFDD